ncbi:MAG: hypothetical protein IPH44_25790 [Myxococcales bacterium]|jgi:hypothetical protein|nr:hypothetical protein [Myxococcales bacterium]MBK7195473.1 hypothetical protein [Myxococcales bacterium]MBP6844218.1 hypothetical protein [Kofleriaceae bacterium]
MRTLLVVGCIALAAAPAAAGGARGRGKKARPKVAAIDVTGAVASGDRLRQCDAAIALVGAGQAAHASLLIGACADLAERAVAAKAARVAIARLAARDAWSTIDIDVVGDAAGVTVTIDRFADVPIAPGAWQLPAGDYTIVARTPHGQAQYPLTIAANSRALVRLTPPPAPAAPTAGVVDFGTDSGAPLDAPLAGPPVVKHGSILPARFRAGLRSRP